MKVQNNQLTSQELEWLNAMFNSEFLYKDIIIDQINNATITKKYTKYYISIKFIISDNFPRVKVSSAVPLEMRAFKKGKPPVQFLLHLNNGLVNELEIISATSSPVDPSMEDTQIELVIDSELKQKHWNDSIKN